MAAKEVLHFLVQKVPHFHILSNHRSYDLQKYKEFKEEEFKIVGYTKGEGRDDEAVLWICETETKLTFTVRQSIPLNKRRELYIHANQYIGKQLTVKFQECTDKGVPRFPVGKAIREDY